MTKGIGRGLQMMVLLGCSDGMLVEADSAASMPAPASGTMPSAPASISVREPPRRAPVLTEYRERASSSPWDPSFVESAAAADVAGTWEGSLRTERFPSGSARVRLVLESPLDGVDDGYLILGEGEPPAEAPADGPFPIEHYEGRPLDETLVFDGLWEGFRYPITIMDPPTAYQPIPLRLLANSFDLFAAWCSSQTDHYAESRTCVPRSYPVPLGNGVDCQLYELDGYLSDGPGARAIEQVPCFEADICLNRCVCVDAQCGAWQVADILMRGAIEADRMEAWLYAAWPPLATPITLTRVAAGTERTP